MVKKVDLLNEDKFRGKTPQDQGEIPTQGPMKGKNNENLCLQTFSSNYC